MVREYDRSKIPSVYHLPDVEPYRGGPGHQQMVFRGSDIMVGFNEIGPAKEKKEPHAHHWEQINLLVDGKLDYIIDDTRVSLEPYDIVQIPAGVEHTSRAVEGESAKHIAIWPLRDDILGATEYQEEFYP